MALPLEAQELVERFLAEVGEEDLHERIDLNNPLDVALLGSRDLLQRALRIASGGPEAGTAQAVVDTPWDSRIRSRYPTHEADSLMILAWAARCDVVDRGENRREPHPSSLVWANRSLRTIFEYQDRAQNEPAGSQLNKSLWSFLIRLAEGPGEEPPEAAQDLAMARKNLARFCEAIKNAPATVLRCSIEGLRAEADRGTFTFTPEGDEKVSPDQLDRPNNQDAVEIFRQSFFLEGNFHVVVGARALHPAGLRLRLVSDENAPFAKYYDLYAVWNLQLPSRTQGHIDPEAFLSLQGLFIPVDIRRRLYDSLSDMHQRHQTAALVARNLSHNLGSHALLYVARELQQAKPEKSNQEGARQKTKETDVAEFLQYLVNRADLVAMLASGPGHPFSVVLPLATAIDQFNNQELLRMYLCASERLKVSRTLLKGDAGTVDLPGGLVGGQALCAILENFARNSAKHSKRWDSAVLSVALDLEVEERDDGLLRCRLSDKSAAPIFKKDFDTLREKVAVVTAPPTGPWGRADTDLNVGFGLEEIATWLAYLRRKADKREWSCNPPLMDYETDELGRLYLIFYLLSAVPVRYLEFAALGKRENLLPAQLTLAHCSGPELMAPRRLPGRWLMFSRENGKMQFRSRFGRFEGPESKWSAINKRTSKEKNLAMAAYVETLRGFALPPCEILSVVVIDGPWYETVRAATGIPRNSIVCAGGLEELISPHPLVRFFVADENAARPEDFEAHLLPGTVAIWHRHGPWLNTLSDSDLGRRVVHYEAYSGIWNQEYLSIFNGQLANSSDALLFVYGQLAEAALLRGYLIDERFAEIYSKDFELRNRLRWMGIQVIDPYATDRAVLKDLFADIGPLGNRRQDWPGGHLNNSFVSIHASLKRSPELMGDLQWKELLDKFGSPIPFLALHSGRGGIEEVRNLDYPFFPASLFQSWAFDRPCKLFMSEALMRGGWI